jgi:hypothetical protein
MQKSAEIIQRIFFVTAQPSKGSLRRPRRKIYSKNAAEDGG